MINKISYTDKLDYYVRHYNLIPYRLHKNARYRNNCFYWIDYENKWFKVEEVEYDFSKPIPLLDHVQVLWMDNLQGYISTDLSIYDFRLGKDKYNIRERKCIVNVDESFAGGEIEYWLFIHNITFLDEKYEEFWKYLDLYSRIRIDPSKYYFIIADEIKVNGVEKYKNVKFIEDPTRTKFRNSKTTNIANIPKRKIRKQDILRERRRREKRYGKKKNKANGYY